MVVKMGRVLIIEQIEQDDIILQGLYFKGR